MFDVKTQEGPIRGMGRGGEGDKGSTLITLNCLPVDVESQHDI